MKVFSIFLEGEEGIASIKRSYRAAAFDEAPLIGRSDSEESDSQRLHDAQKDSDESDSDQVFKDYLPYYIVYDFQIKLVFLGEEESEEKEGHY